MTFCVSFFRPLLALALWAVMPAASAFLLSTQANNDPRPSPITSPSGMVVVSGSATAADNGIPNQYPGKVICRGGNGCNFGPVASPEQTLNDGDNVIALKAYVQGEPKAIAIESIRKGRFVANSTFTLAYP